MPTFSNDSVVSNSSAGGAAVIGRNNSSVAKSGNGGWFESEQGEGVRGWSKNANHGAVVGVNTGGGNGGWFESEQGEGVRGWSQTPHHGGVVGVNTAKGIGVFGTSADGVAIWATSNNNEGLHAVTHSMNTAAIAAYQTNPESDSAALFVKHYGNRTAAAFEGRVHVQGDVEVTGDIRLINADCAEDFDIAESHDVSPGTVVVFGHDGALRPCGEAYDKKVAGIVSGAGEYQPAIVLDRHASEVRRLPVALLGKVFCNVDADAGAIEIGDLLTTSSRAGYAMKASDASRAFGAVIGKALRPLRAGFSQIPVLVALQ